MSKTTLNLNNLADINEDSDGEKLTMSKMDKKCAPSYGFSSGSCIPLDILVAIAKEYNNNSKSDNDKIELDNKMELLHPKKYKKYLVSVFSEKFSNKCKDQRCWLTMDFLNNIGDKFKQNIEGQIYRPIGPQGKFEWLNTININQVMEQYTAKYKDFVFLGAVPMDFYEINVNGIRDIKWEDVINKGVKRVGIVYNLDNHNQPGSHWVAGYIDFDNCCLYYYDSYATKPGKRVREFYAIIDKAIKKKLDRDAKIEHNTHRHQYKDSECGMFSLHFIISMLEGGTFEGVCGGNLNDDLVNKLRDEYFILPKNFKSK